MKYLYLILVAALLTASCNKDHSIPYQPVKYKLKSTKFYFTDGSYYNENYSYTAEDKLLKLEHKDQAGTLMSKLDYAYKNKLVEGAILWDAVQKVALYGYTYTNSKPVKFAYMEYEGAEPDTIYTQDFEHTGNKLSKISVTHYNGSPAYYILVTFTGKNITKQQTFATESNELLEETVYQYDSKINPFYKWDLPEPGNPKYASENNITKITTTKADGTTTVLNLLYDYNLLDLPVKQYNKLANGTKLHEQSYEYNYR